MSAFAKITTQIKDLAMLKKSLADLGLTNRESEKGVKFYGVANPMDLDIYVAQHKFGFVKNAADNSYDLVGDSDHRAIYEKLRQKYSENVARQLLSARGFTVANVETLANGEIKLVAKRFAY
jgi:hypothetical protein